MHRMIRKTARSIKNIIVYLFDSTVISTQKNKNNKIAIIRLDAIGDFTLWLSTAQEYKKLYPESKIILIANAQWSTWAGSIGIWDEVWPINIKKLSENIFYRWACLRKIRQAGFETAIQPTYSRVYMHGDSVVRATNARNKIGFWGDYSNITKFEKFISDRWYTKLIHNTSRKQTELEINAEFISTLAKKNILPSMPLIPRTDNIQPDFILDHDFFIIFPGASWYGRRWEPNKFASLAMEINRKYNLKPVICGAQSEIYICNEIARLSSVQCLNLAGKTNLIELTELIREAKFVISNETSGVHIAAAVGTKSVCILGGGHFGRFLPYPEIANGIKPVVISHMMPCFGCNWRCTQPHKLNEPVPCISQITVAEIFKEILNITQKNI